jgi:nucleoside 2-deoxyribosyltransferase
MKIYVAGRFKSFRKVRRVIDSLKEQGHTVTYDWTRSKEFDTLGEPVSITEHEIPDSELIGYAKKDLLGVEQCDVVVLCGEPDLCGAYMEVGAALAYGKRVFVVDQQRWTIFYKLPNVTLFDSYGDLYSYLQSEVS